LALQGDVKRGKVVATRCYVCHKIDNVGALFGPDITGFAQSRSAEVIVTDMLDPNLSISRGFEGTCVVMNNGKVIEGLLQSVTTQTMQLTVMGGGSLTAARKEVKSYKGLSRYLAVYYAVISHMDEQIGRILDVLDQTRQTKDTLVIFTSDHGLAVGSHGLMGKQNMYEHTIRVPLVMAGPGKRNTALCYLRDLFPTTCELVGLPIPESVEGRSLKPVIREEKNSVYSEIYGYFRDKQRMVRDQRWKLIHYLEIDRYQLFDLNKDPFEKNDLIVKDHHAQVVRHLQSLLAQKMKQWEVPLN
jgi:putative heme-binding domain-containing protein